MVKWLKSSPPRIETEMFFALAAGNEIKKVKIKATKLCNGKTLINYLISSIIISAARLLAPSSPRMLSNSL